MSLSELRNLCKENKIKGYSGCSKKELLLMLKSKDINIPSSPTKKNPNLENTKMGKLQNIVFQCRDFLRSVGITGLEAFLNINMILIFKEVEKKWGNELSKPENYTCNFESKGCAKLARTFKDKYYSFSELCEFPTDSSIQHMNEDIKEAIFLLQRHKIVGKIFDSFNDLGFLRVKDNRLLRSLFWYIRDNLDLSEDSDIMGDAYESVLSSLSSESKELGKFFTPRKIVDLALKLATNFNLSSKRELGDVLDPTCGSGGFLVRCHNSTSLSGCDIDPNHIPICVNNIFLHFSSKEIGMNVVCANFLTHPLPKNKFDTILSNPPFGLKKISLKTIKGEFEKNHRDRNLFTEVYPFDVSPTFLFVEKMLYHLKIGGRMCVVLPNGSEMTGSGKLLEFRKMVMKGCNIRNIVSFVSGVFSNTGVRTTLLVLDKIINFGIELKEKEDYSTSSIEFMECNEDCEIVNKEIIPIDRIVDNGFSWSLNTYISSKREGNSDEIIFDRNIEMMKLSDIAIISFGKRILKKDSEGKIPVYGGGGITFFTDKSNREGKTCKISRFGVSEKNCVSILNEKYWLNDSGFTINSKNEKLVDEFLWYYLLHNKILIYSLCDGAAQKNINLNKFYDLEIPIPSIEVQNYLVKELDLLSEGIENLKKCVITYQNLMRSIIEIKNKKNSEMIKLRDICKLNNVKKRTSKNADTSGKYPFYTGSFGEKFFIDDVDILEDTIIINRTNGKGKCNIILAKNCCVATQTITLSCDNLILLKYIFYYLRNNIDVLEKGYIGSNHKNLSNDYVAELAIRIPQIEVQNYIVKELDDLSSQIEKFNEKILFLEKKTKELLYTTLGIEEDTTPIEKSLQMQFDECIRECNPFPFINLKKLRKIRREMEKRDEYPLNFYIPYQLFNEDGVMLTLQDDETLRLEIIKIYIGYSKPSLKYDVNNEDPFCTSLEEGEEEIPRKHSLLQEMLNPYFMRRMPQFDSITEYISQYEIEIPREIEVSEMWDERINSLSLFKKYFEDEA